MKIVFVASEITPFAKTGGLADVAGALPLALHRLGHDLRSFMPLYGSIHREHYRLEAMDSIREVPLRFGEDTYRFSLYRGVAPNSDLAIYFIDCPQLFQRKTLYTTDIDEHRRFLMLQRATLESCQRMQFAPDIMHCNDWHSALLPLLLKTSYAWDRLFDGTRSLLSIHNIGYQGVFDAPTLLDVGLDDVVNHVDSAEWAEGRINWLLEGIRHADRISTVSPTYAHEICGPQFGMGMEDALNARPDGVVGILNGVDYAVWNPASDGHLPATYSATNLKGKQVCKQTLLHEAGLTLNPKAPLIGAVSRLAHQKGIDILMDSLPALLITREFGLCVLGSGEERYVAFFTKLAERFPDRVYFCNGYDERLAHLIEAGSDMFLMPSLYEPCGLNQLYSLKYGTPPIVRKTGGLADSVSMWDGTQGTGVVFNDFDAPAVTWAVNTALDLYRDSQAWTTIQRNAMHQDFSWEAQAIEYVKLYQSLHQ